VESAGTWVLAVTENTIDLDSDPQTDNQTVCINSPINAIVYRTAGATGATVSNLPTGVTYTWNSGTVSISGTPSVTGTFNYTVILTGGGGNVTASGTITVSPQPTLVLAAGSEDSPTIALNTPITPISYTANNTTAVTLANGSTFPPGVTGTLAGVSYTIAGTPTTEGTYTYTLTTNNTNACADVTVSGTITVLFVPPGSGTNTWTCGSQTWSRPVQIIPACAKDTFSNGDNIPNCRKYSRSDVTYFYYNWYYVNANGTTMCPAPWRVPTQNDFIALDKCLGGTGLDRPKDTITVAKYIQDWGGTYGAMAVGKATVPTVGAFGYYWSSTSYNNNNNNVDAYYLGFYPSGKIDLHIQLYKDTGLQVRCLKDDN
jgi:uncharacterized protein (TIGR02145 family)